MENTLLMLAMHPKQFMLATDRNAFAATADTAAVTERIEKNDKHPRKEYRLATEAIDM
jgi:hypothetical protein